MEGGRVQIVVNGRSIDGYFAPAAIGRGPGVIVLQEWWGLVPHIESVCDLFAAEGFTALAPDLYHGRSAKSPDEAGKLMMAINIAETEADLRGAVRHLLACAEVTSKKVGTVGFCMGGQLSLYAACSNSDVGACVDFYGVHPHVQLELAKLQAPVLGFFGALDSGVPPAVAHELESKLRAAGKSVEVHIFDGARHAFFNDTRKEVYNAAAAQQSWKRMLAFYREHLT